MTLLSLAAGTALAASAGPALAYWHDNRPIITNAEALMTPLTIANWSPAQPSKIWRPIYDGKDLEFITSLTPDASEAHAVDVAVEYFGRIREGHSPIAATNSLWDGGIWHPARARGEAAAIGTQQLRLNEVVLSSARQKRLVWSAYWMDGRFVTSGLAIKLTQLKTLFTGDESAAVVALSTPIDGAEEDARERLRTALMSLSDLPAHLAAAGRQDAASKPLN